MSKKQEIDTVSNPSGKTDALVNSGTEDENTEVSEEVQANVNPSETKPVPSLSSYSKGCHLRSCGTPMVGQDHLHHPRLHNRLRAPISVPAKPCFAAALAFPATAGRAAEIHERIVEVS